MIAIKLADGSFHSLFNEQEKSTQKITIVPANKSQTSIVIPFFRSQSSDISNPQYIGKFELKEYSTPTLEDNEVTITLDIQLLHNDTLRIIAKKPNGMDATSYIHIHEVDDMLNDSNDEFKIDDISNESNEESEFVIEEIENFDQEGFLDPSDEFIGESEPAIEDTESASDSIEYDSTEENDIHEKNESPLNKVSSLSPGLIAIFSILAAAILTALGFLFFLLTQGENIPFMQALLTTIQSLFA